MKNQAITNALAISSLVGQRNFRAAPVLQQRKHLEATTHGQGMALHTPGSLLPSLMGQRPGTAGSWSQAATQGGNLVSDRFSPANRV